jgi:ankyrin repeat protein
MLTLLTLKTIIPRLNPKSPDDINIFFYAIRENLRDAVAVCLDYGMDPNVCDDKNGITGLMYAAQLGYIKIAELYHLL